MPTRILLAEDDPIQRMELRHILTEQGYLVVGEVADGQSVVDVASTLRPDLVLMDIRLPGRDGISAAAILRQEDIAPVVLLSAFSGAWFIEKAKDAGVLNYLIKPLRESEIRPTIEVALARDKDRRIQEGQINLLNEQLEARKRAEREKGLLLEMRRLEETKRQWEDMQ
jgi:AmiR/NasT family two-component response regulator